MVGADEFYELRRHPEKHILLLSVQQLLSARRSPGAALQLLLRLLPDGLVPPLRLPRGPLRQDVVSLR